MDQQQDGHSLPYGAGEMATANMASDKQELKNGMPAGPGDGPAKGERDSEQNSAVYLRWYHGLYFLDPCGRLDQGSTVVQVRRVPLI